MDIRNFSIISHIDHGKSTLADRFLELTGTISSKKMRPQFLDMMDLERERGITIKMQPIRMEYRVSNLESRIRKKEFKSNPSGSPLRVQQKQPFGESASRPAKFYILNLIDTPGHVDFSYEVSRSLAAVEGAILLVDATKGIQAQTLANLELARRQKLVIIPVVNKIDLPHADIEKTSEELANLLKINKDKIIKISAKIGTNIKQVFEAVVKDIPPPEKDNLQKSFRALIFDSKYDPYKGIIAYVRVIDGEIEKNKKIKLLAAEALADAKEVGYFIPELSSQNKLSAGEIGYIATGIKEPGKVRVGDTIIKSKIKNQKSKIADAPPLRGYQEPKPMVFASLYPENPDDFDLLKDALSKLKLSDPSLIFEPETKEALGRGFRCGFLGTLHTEIVSDRLLREFNLNLIISTPSVVYRIIDKKGKEKLIYSAVDWPETSQTERFEEPWVFLEVITPVKYIGKVSEILKNLRGNYIETKYLGAERVILIYELPLREILVNLYDKIKSVSQGYASMNYKVLDFRTADLVKMEVLIAGEKREAFSKIVPKDKAFQEGKKLVKKLKETLPPQQFSVALQAVVGGKIIARETIKARRKDVTAPLYGGDITRKRKLLEKQKKGKKKLKGKGKVRIPPDVFLKIFRS